MIVLLYSSYLKYRNLTGWHKASCKVQWKSTVVIGSCILLLSPKLYSTFNFCAAVAPTLQQMEDINLENQVGMCMLCVMFLHSVQFSLSECFTFCTVVRLLHFSCVPGDMGRGFSVHIPWAEYKCGHFFFFLNIWPWQVSYQGRICLFPSFSPHQTAFFPSQIFR